MVIVSSDVTNVAVKPFIIAVSIVNNDDGSISLFLPNGQYAGQEPNAYGVRNDNSGIGAYQKFTRQGALLISITRPGDTMFVYSIAEGQAFL